MREADPGETTIHPSGSSWEQASDREVPRSHRSIHDEGRFLPATVIGGRYRIINLIGRGGMGEVYRATDMTLGQSVALKFLPAKAASNPAQLERFHGEVRVARQVSHPNVCRVYDIGETQGLPFISMEYVDGEDLSVLLSRVGRLSADKAADVSRKICLGLAAAHSKGVIHRDLKPQNIMMNRRGDIVIMDFGLSAIAEQITGPEARNGTPIYMSPEQLRGSTVDARSDIFSLGLVLYELFTGRRPYDARSVPDLMDRVESAQFASISSIVSEVDPDVDEVIRRCLDPDPQNRPSSALAVLGDLPGGDPLAIALASGHLPSPDTVAAAGKLDGLRLRYSVLCLAVVIASLAVAPVLKQRKIAFYQTRLDYTPDVLRQKARDIAAGFGYSGKPFDEEKWLGQRFDVLSYMNSRKGPRDWKQWLDSEAPVSLTYRGSPEAMVAPPAGYVTGNNPALATPGMVTMELDGNGRLRRFEAVPKDTSITPPILPEAVFRAADLDISKFHEVSPPKPPRVAADEVRAWSGPHPVIPDTELTLQITSWKGQLTNARVLWPWMLGGKSASREQSFLAEHRGLFLMVLTLTGLSSALLLALRNIKLGRGDRRGALRIACVEFLFTIGNWLFTTHVVRRDDFLNLFWGGLSESLFSAAVLYILYLALEPALRARWPQSIVTWNRLLAWRWRDPQVGGHVLIGAAIGTLAWVVGEVRDLLAASVEGLDTAPGLFMLNGSPQWIAGILNRASQALKTGLIIFFIVFIVRMICRKDWISGVVGALIFASIQSDLVNAVNFGAQFAIYVLIYSAFTFALLRLGLVVTISAVFFLNVIEGLTLGTDWSAWYSPAGFSTALLLVSITLIAFRNSLGSRALLTAGSMSRSSSVSFAK